MSYEDRFHLSGGEIIRQITFGLNDGIVSIFALLAGIYGSGQDDKVILITLLAAAVAGALSMAAGEFISGKGERDYYNHEIDQERLEIKLCPDIEKEEIRFIYQDKGFSGEILDTIVNHITSDRDLWVREMVISELGVTEVEDAKTGIRNSIVIFFTFILGSLFPTLPYLILLPFTVNPFTKFIIATIITFGGLFLAGALKKFVTGKNWIKSGLEMLLVGAFAFSVSYFIGLAIELL
ncbi:MAG: VIT1/CCC1 transporter family protein [Candidatus Lokiarchaeota archaeon]|nr:VIT1/CCC1 transporter family protein [Candidatus Lokiarchaeota archaeon]